MKQQQVALVGPSPAPTEMRSRPRSEAFEEGHAPATPDPRLDERGQFDATKAGGQLPMFLSAREVSKNYRLLDGDRHPTRTVIDKRPFVRLETDVEVLQRKRGEADRPRSKVHGSGLAKTLAQDSYRVEQPIPLQVPGRGSEHENRDMSRRGVSGDPRPQTLGGGHRIAVLGTQAPDRPMPVEHYDQSSPVERMESPAVQRRVDRHVAERHAVQVEAGELRTGSPRVPRPVPADQVLLTSQGVYPKGTSELVGHQLKAMKSALETDVSKIRQKQKRHDAMSHLLHRLVGR